jgi:porin
MPTFRRIAPLALALAGPFAALAGPPPLAVPVTSEPGAQASDPFAFLENLNRSNYFLGDLFGLRPWLSGRGMSLAIQETSEYLGNASGGIAQGGAYDGLTQAVLQLDTQRAFGHPGGLFNASLLHIHGTNLSATNLATLQTASGIEADRGLRLWEFWYDQRLLEEDRLDVRIGQQSVDQEFIVSPNALLFVNTMFGWPALPSYDLPGGGPAYPLSVPGLRVRWRPVNALNVLLGVFNGSPVKDNQGDPQRQDAHGTTFPMNGGTLTFLELQYVDPALGGMVYPGEAAPLARTYRIGAWYDSQRFDDLRHDAAGLSLADPASGAPATHRGNLSVYAVADQMLWRSGGDPNHTLNAFLRAMGTPYADRNLVAFSLNAGLVLHEPFRNRADDTLGIGVGSLRVSSQAAGLDRDTAAYAQAAGLAGYYPVRCSESYLEITYQYQAHPWWQIQPDLQYVWNPGGGLVDSAAPTRRIRNEVVLGVRTNILF